MRLRKAFAIGAVALAVGWVDVVASLDHVQAGAAYKLTQVDPHNFVRFSDDAEAERRRAALINAIWPGGRLPAEREPDLQLVGPRTPVGYAIVHRGHDDQPMPSLVQALVADGYAVAELRMPQVDHDLLFSWYGTFAFRYFLDPIIRAVNEFEARSRGRAPIVMVGLSGGGWATEMAAAIDTRIDVSIAVAGSLPLYARPFSWGSQGDAEQVWPAIYGEADTNHDGVPDAATGAASWLEIYALGAWPGRRQVQVFIPVDPCCFGGNAWTSYESFLTRLAPGFSIWVDRSTVNHEISPATVENVVLPSLPDSRPIRPWR